MSGFLLDSFVEKLSDTFVKGEISIGNWASEKGAPIQVRAKLRVLRLVWSILRPTEATLVDVRDQCQDAYTDAIGRAFAARCRSVRYEGLRRGRFTTKFRRVRILISTALLDCTAGTVTKMQVAREFI